MESRHPSIGLQWLLALLVLLLGSASASATQQHGPLVLAASSMQESLNTAADAWAAKGHPRPILSFAASSTLARQIESGAPADLFLSADEQWMDYVQQRRLLARGSRSDLVANRLVLVAPVKSRTRLTVGRGFALARALGRGRLAMADPDSVPAGKYGKQALTRLGVWPQVAHRIARAENVRAALALAARREAPLGIVYATDVRASRDVRVVGLFPTASHAPIRYPLARLASSRHRDAEPFRRFLLSHEGRTIFQRFGFLPPR